MAKPIIYFKGTKFKAGTTVGYRPQLVKCTNSVKDAALAEEICIESGLSMSPTELLHAIQMTLEHAPRLVATDGRVREFTNLLCWNRSSSGRVDGAAGAWNDTCSAKVLVQLKKNSKQLINATFKNEYDLPVPKLDNVTYPGASLVNILKVGEQICAYGRNMQMVSGSGDVADLIVNGATYPLQLVSSDVTTAKFSWPSALTTLEDGTAAEFVMTSHAGIEGGAYTTNTKKVVILATAQPLAQTSDGKLKIMTLTGGSGGTLAGGMNYGEAWNFTGSGIWATPEETEDWIVSNIALTVGGEDHGSTTTFPESGTSVSAAFSQTGKPAAGAYENCTVTLTCFNLTSMESEELQIAVPVVIVS